MRKDLHACFPLSNLNSQCHWFHLPVCLVSNIEEFKEVSGNEAIERFGLSSQEHTSVLGDMMRHEKLLIYIICIIQEILTFTFKHAVFHKIDQSNVFHGGFRRSILRCKLQFQIMIADGSKLGIIVKQAGREREYSNQSKTYCSHLLLLPERGSIRWPTQINAVAVQREKSRLLTKECSLN